MACQIIPFYFQGGEKDPLKRATSRKKGGNTQHLVGWDSSEPHLILGLVGILDQHLNGFQLPAVAPNSPTGVIGTVINDHLG